MGAGCVVRLGSSGTPGRTRHTHCIQHVFRANRSWCLAPRKRAYRYGACQGTHPNKLPPASPRRESSARGEAHKPPAVGRRPWGSPQPHGQLPYLRPCHAVPVTCRCLTFCASSPVHYVELDNGSAPCCSSFLCTCCLPCPPDPHAVNSAQRTRGERPRITSYHHCCSCQLPHAAFSLLPWPFPSPM